MSNIVKPQSLPLLPLRDLIVFPHMMMPLFVAREKSINALEEAMTQQSDIILAAQKDAKTNSPEPNDIYRVGTVGTIIQLLRLPDGTVKVLIEGKRRVLIKNFLCVDDFFLVESEELVEMVESEKEALALVRSIKSTFETYVKLNKRIPPEILMRVANIDGISEMADIIAAQLNLKLEDKQKILEITDPGRRLEELLSLMTGEIEILEVEKKIRYRVKKQMEKSQKEYYLNEQMQAIQKELGDKDDHQAELEELEQKFSEKNLPEVAKKKIKREIKKLKMMSPMSAEAAVVRNYVDWMLDLPWLYYSEEKKEIHGAKAILDEDHWGLEKVKDRIVEHLSVQILTDKLNGPILCLVGPPGVGKTSLARSVARALGRSFARISLGGVRDEAEIRGHRRTYVGAMPGKIIQSLRKCDTGNPLLLLDEVDKMSMDFRGDPSAALLEVFDPEQNVNFQDHYIELEYDLSQIMFITTANSIHPIPRPLLDRMEVIHLDGYIEKEKFNIAKKYLIPKQLEQHGLVKYNVEFTEPSIREIICSYTREAGVRDLNRKIAKICRKSAKDIVQKQSLDEEKQVATTMAETAKTATTKVKISETTTGVSAKSSAKSSKKFAMETSVKSSAKSSSARKSLPSVIRITPKKVLEYLGADKYKPGKIEGQDEIGLTNGMAWTQVGGELLPIEASVVPGRGKFSITGQLGDIMKESCSAAMSYVRSRGPLFGFDKEFYANIDVHIHAPDGSIPKDGPSAGVAITTSIVSAMTKIPVKRTVAMTGEVTLRGRVLTIGGLKEKVLAAHRGRIKTVIIPKENAKDIKDIPKEILKDLKVILVDHVDQVLVNALNIKTAKELFKVRSDRGLGLRAQYTGHSQHVSPPQHH